MKYHELSVEQMAHKARSQSVHCRGSKGLALQIVIAGEREYAKNRGLIYVQPDLKQVLEILAL